MMLEFLDRVSVEEERVRASAEARGWSPPAGVSTARISAAGVPDGSWWVCKWVATWS